MSRNLFRLRLIVSLSFGIFLIGFPVSMVNAGEKYAHQFYELSSPESNMLRIAIKAKLREKGYYKGSISGDDIKDTLKFNRALDEYRKDNFLKNDGLMSTLKSLGITNKNEVLIIALKGKLKEKGYYKGKINGQYDIWTEYAIWKYRQANGQKEESLNKTLKSLGLINDN